MNAVFLMCWICILISVCIANNKKFLRIEAILGAVMGIAFYAEKIFT